MATFHTQPVNKGASREVFAHLPALATPLHNQVEASMVNANIK
jgi:hypothetical protein